MDIASHAIHFMDFFVEVVVGGLRRVDTVRFPVAGAKNCDSSDGTFPT